MQEPDPGLLRRARDGEPDAFEDLVRSYQADAWRFARSLTRDQVERADVILTMTEAQAERVATLGGAGKVHTLPAFARYPDSRREVLDPFGLEVESYRAMGEHLEILLDAVTMRLRAERPH